MSEPKTVSILSIDAWANGPGWTWNNWHKIGEIQLPTFEALTGDDQILAWLISEGYLKSTVTLADIEIDDDQYNVVICDRSAIDAPEDCDCCDCTEHQHSAMPVIAIAYGEAF